MRHRLNTLDFYEFWLDEWELAVVRKRSWGRCELNTERDET